MLEWIPPEMRENLGEIALAKKGGKGLPKLIEYNRPQYIAITDHTKSPEINERT
jgi:hypothetical protein